MVTKSDLPTLCTLSIAEACLLKFYIISPSCHSLEPIVGSLKQKSLVLETYTLYSGLLEHITNTKRQTFRSRAIKMADLAKAYMESGMSRDEILEKLPKVVRETNITNTASKGRPVAMMPYSRSIFKKHEFRRNQHGVVLPEDIIFQMEIFEIAASVRLSDLKVEWLSPSRMKIQVKYSDPMNYPLTLMQIFKTNGTPTFSPDDPAVLSFEDNIKERRGLKDGYVWEGFQIEYDRPQDPSTVSLGDGLNGFDVVQVPHLRDDGEQVQLNLLIVCTRTPKPVDSPLQAGYYAVNGKSIECFSIKLKLIVANKMHSF